MNPLVGLPNPLEAEAPAKNRAFPERPKAEPKAARTEAAEAAVVPPNLFETYKTHPVLALTTIDLLYQTVPLASFQELLTKGSTVIFSDQPC